MLVNYQTPLFMKNDLIIFLYYLTILLLIKWIQIISIESPHVFMSTKLIPKYSKYQLTYHFHVKINNILSLAIELKVK